MWERGEKQEEVQYIGETVATLKLGERFNENGKKVKRPGSKICTIGGKFLLEG